MYLARQEEFLNNNTVLENIATLVRLKLFCQKIMNGDSQVIFHIFKVKYLKIMC